MQKIGANNIPTVLVVLGATGDLMSKKIIPALFDLFVKNKLPEMFRVVGFSRRALSTESFHERIKEILSDSAAAHPKKIDIFLNLFVFQQGSFEKLKDYAALAKIIARIDAEWRVCTNKLFYLAVAPDFFRMIMENLAASDLTKACSPGEGWTRVLVEKPFGKNLATAEKLDKLLGRLFKEEQIYRIDHYLAKEILQNILLFRFTNNLFEKIWNNQFIERIDIRLWETIGVENRGAFYDGVGALRDVGQNHLLQMLALVTMEDPREFSTFAIRRERIAILKTLPNLTAREIRTKTFRAQYRDYKKNSGVAPNSTTETYFKVETELTGSRWRGVVITLESGKRITQNKKEIVVTFKHSTPCLCPPNEPHHKNEIIFSLEPTEGIKIKFWSKELGLDFAVKESSLDFMLRPDRRHTQYVEEYEKLLLDCIKGDQTLFNHTEEMKAMWNFTDPIIAGWKKNLTPLKFYEPDTKEIISMATWLPTPSALPHRTVGIIGLGKMGANIARHLLENDWKVIGFNRTKEVTKTLENEGLIGAYSLQELINQLPAPRIIWLMLTAGRPVDEILFGADGLVRQLKKGDVVIDAGNSFYGDSVIRHKKLSARGINFMDVGFSGGPGGARLGGCLMVGGERKIFAKLEKLFRDLAREQGYQFFSGAGSGHFVKMVHNGIEYGMMQAIAEGFTVLKNSPYNLNLRAVAEIYSRGSVIESRLINWLKGAYDEYGEKLNAVSGEVAATGEGQWTVETAKQLGIMAPVIEQSLKFRAESKQKPSYTGQILSALRNQFGGHAIKPAAETKKEPDNF